MSGAGAGAGTGVGGGPGPGATVMTVLGPVAPSELGLTLPHEHILWDLSSWFAEAPGKPGLAATEVTLETHWELAHDPMANRLNLVFADEEGARAELAAFREAGGGTIVDVSLDSIGRAPAALRRLAEATGVTIVCGCGHYVQAAHPPEVAGQTVDELAAWLIGEIRDGIGDTGVRPGIIGELGTSHHIHPDERKVLEAAALAHRETGLAITIHSPVLPTEPEGVAIVDILQNAGADPERVIIGHLSHTIDDLDYHRRIAATGACLQYDRFGAEFVYESLDYREPRDHDVVAAVAQLVAEGHARQIMLSHDVCMRVQQRRHGGGGYTHLARHIVPGLLAAGVSERDIRLMTVDNPARFLSVTTPVTTSGGPA